MKICRILPVAGLLLLGAACSPSFEEGQDAYGQEQFERAYEILLPWAEKGNPEAQNYVGTMLNEGKGIAQDHDAARDWFIRAAEAGMPKAQYNLGVIYARGHNVDIDYSEAYLWFSLAADRGLEQAGNGLTLCRQNMTEAEIDAAERRVLDWESR